MMKGLKEGTKDYMAWLSKDAMGRAEGGRCQSDAKDVSLGMVKRKRPPLDKSDLIGVGFS
jgi:hypothetical protein